MFDLANIGLVAWPTKVPDLEQTDHESGGNVMQTIDVRYQILDRTELRALDAERARTMATIAAERFAEIGAEHAPEGATLEQMEAFQRGRADRLKAATEELAARFAESEDRKVARLRERVRAWRPTTGADWVPFEADQLEQLLRLSPYVNAFDEGLLAASRGARAKN